MSGRKKRLRKQVIGQMLAKQISVPEARARMAWIKTGVYQPPPRRPVASRGTVVKSAARAGGYERYFDNSDPQIREWARAAAEQELVTKGLRPGPAPGRQSGEVRFVPGTGPDGRFMWQRPQAPEPGLQIAPPGTAGR